MTASLESVTIVHATHDCLVGARCARQIRRLCDRMKYAREAYPETQSVYARHESEPKARCAAPRACAGDGT